MKVTISLVCALALAAKSLGANEPLSLKVRPNVAMAPATVIVLAMIEPDMQNRAVEIVVESDDFYRSSVIQLEGDRSRRTNQFELRSLPPGEYEVRATLKGPGEAIRVMIQRRISIVGEGNLPGISPSALPRGAGRR